MQKSLIELNKDNKLRYKKYDTKNDDNGKRYFGYIFNRRYIIFICE